MRCKACQEKDAHIVTLKEQIEWLRLHSGTPLLIPKPQADDIAWEPAAWVSEEEEELQAMRQAGLLDTVELQKALSEINSLDDIHIEP